jgi:hypothetical protein
MGKGQTGGWNWSCWHGAFVGGLWLADFPRACVQRSSIGLRLFEVPICRRSAIHLAHRYSTRIVRGLPARSQTLPKASRANNKPQLTSGLTLSQNQPAPVRRPAAHRRTGGRISQTSPAPVGDFFCSRTRPTHPAAPFAPPLSPPLHATGISQSALGLASGTGQYQHHSSGVVWKLV